MKYNFDEVIDRRGTGSSKWDNLEKRFGEKDLLPLWVADMDFAVAGPIVEAIQKRAAHPIYGYTERPESACVAIRDWLQRRHGWKIETDWVSFTTGVVNALDIAVLSFTNPGDKVIVQPPVYAPFFRAIENNGCQVVNNPLKLVDSRYVMDLDDLEKKFDSRTKLLILCSPHNPVGRVWTENELEKLAELCLQNNVVIISDEIHSDFIYQGYKHIPLASISEDIARNTVTCIAPSKTFNVAGLATGVAIIANPRLREVFNNTLENVGVSTGIFGMVALEAAYRYGEDWLDQLLQYLEENLQFLMEFIERRIPEIKVIRPEGTYLVWLDCRELGLEGSNLKDFMLRKAKVVLNDGSWFGPGGEGFQRINIGCPRSILEKALCRIEKAVRGLR